MSLAKLKDLIKKNNIKIIDFRFVDLPGLWQHFSTTTGEIGKGLFDDGIGFDGSSIRGFQEIHESDMVLYPDVDTAFVDPFFEVPHTGSPMRRYATGFETVSAQPSYGGKKCRELFEIYRHRRHLLHWPGT